MKTTILEYDSVFRNPGILVRVEIGEGRPVLAMVPHGTPENQISAAAINLAKAMLFVRGKDDTISA